MTITVIPETASELEVKPLGPGFGAIVHRLTWPPLTTPSSPPCGPR